jgi:hypothetical protein
VHKIITLPTGSHTLVTLFPCIGAKKPGYVSPLNREDTTSYSGILYSYMWESDSLEQTSCM